MKLLADESLDHGIIRMLEENGFSVYSITDNCSGISDDEVLQLAFVRNELLLTEDKDFGELTIRFNKPNCGIILVRANDQSCSERFEFLLHVLHEKEAELKQCFVVIDSDGIRIRRLK
jgi:predicted nuclease of predicted toxin-antitoxin system